MINFLPEVIIQLDYRLFSTLNGKWHNSFFDFVLPFIREPFVWMPFYFFLVIFAILNFRWRGWAWVLFLIINVAISDYVSSTIIKENFFRIRPCSDPALVGHIRFLVSYCPRSSSFTSSHAVNHFAAAMFIFTTFKKAVSPKWAFLFLWAFADVFCGAIVGLILGYIPAKVFNAKIGLKLPG